jgi:hypothetical protein
MEDQSGRCVHVAGAKGCVRNAAGLWEVLALVQPGTLFAGCATHLRWEECELARVFRERVYRAGDDSMRVSDLTEEERAFLVLGEYDLPQPAEIGSRVFAYCSETRTWVECALVPVPDPAMRVLEDYGTALYLEGGGGGGRRSPAGSRPGD